MTSRELTKPGKGKPTTDAEKLAVLQMEQEVVQRHAVQGHSFYRIDRDLGITNSNRVYKRAMSVRPVVQRQEAAEIQRARLDALHEKAWEAISDDGLEPLAQRVAQILAEAYEVDEWDSIPDRVRNTIERAYADTYRGIPVALGVHDRFVKLDGLDHAARVADAQLEIDAGKLAVMAGALVAALELVELSNDDRARVITAWGELVDTPDDSLDLDSN